MSSFITYILNALATVVNPPAAEVRADVIKEDKLGGCPGYGNQGCT